MKDRKSMQRLSFIIFFSFFAGFLSGMQGYAQTALKPNPKAEEWVKKQVAERSPAVLLERFSNEEDCILGGSFLEKLLVSIQESDDSKTPVVQIQHAVIVGNVDLRDREFSCGVVLKNCRFEGKVDFSNCHFPQGLNVEDTIFVQSADFHEIRVEGDASLHQAVFQKRFDMRGALIQGNLISSNARFLDREKGAIFSGTEASRNIVFKQALFEGPVLMADVTAGEQFIADEARFLNADDDALIPRLFANGAASFVKAEFGSAVDFSGAEIHGRFIANQAKFSNAAHLLNLKIDDGLFFIGATGLGPVRFGGSDVRGTLNVSGAKFLNPEAAVDFTQTSVREALFIDCQFEGPLRLDRFSYESILAGDRDGQCNALLALVEKAQFSVNAYQRMESYFQDRGYPQSADRIYYAFKERERRERLQPQSFEWCSNWLLGKTTGHGRSPERPLAVCAVIVIFGMIFMFRAKRMKALDPYAKQPFSPFWYSLDLFLPFIDLKTAQYWIPKPGAPITRFYSRVHILLGWIFIPLFLASWFGWIG